MLNTLFSSKPLPGVLLLLLLYSCGQYQGSDFEPQLLRQLTAEGLVTYADTSSVLTRVRAMENPSQQVDSLLHFAEWVKNYDEDATLRYAQLAYYISTENNWNIPRGISANRLAWSKGKRAKYGEDVEDALVDAQISKRLLTKHKYPYWEVDVSNLLGYLYNRQGEQDSARFYFTRALELTPQLSLEQEVAQKNKAMILHNLATTYSSTDSIAEQAYYEESDRIFQDLDNWENRTRLWLDWATFYMDTKKQFQQADSLLNFCLTYGQANKDQDLLVRAYQRRGYLYRLKFNQSGHLTDFAIAVEQLKKSLTLPSDNAYRTYQLLGNVFQDSWAIDIDESHADSAIFYYKKAMLGAKEEGGIRVMESISEELAYLYSYSDGLHQDALGEAIGPFLNENYTGVVYTITNYAKTAYQRINQVEQRDLRVSAANKRQRQLMIGLTALLTVGVLFVIFLQRLQNHRLKAEMAALRAQINPHFISNSLNAIEHLVNKGEARKASKYLVHFSRLTRQILNGSANNIISLAQELKTLKHFLALEQLRFSDKLTFNIEYDPNIPTEDIATPALILQPYLENAILHGIKPKPEGGHINLWVRQEEKVLKFVIEDNGIGREAARKQKEASVLQQQKSMGMDITQQRLKSLGRVKGPALQIEDLYHDNGVAAGTRVTLRLPLKLLKNNYSTLKQNP
ncbi:sensor histidine kinase [Lewinella cohaerens]|uniref:sensor histidine kinase n=1 Tax=Lewinella cohaerens TaxID=70995 RepID=UPI00036B1A44|nr:histidine kinase [Lewinella cohaerens]